MSTPIRVLMEGTIEYLGTRDTGSWDWMTARVFVLDYTPGGFGSLSKVTVIARETMYRGRVPSPVGSIHQLDAFDEDDEGYKGKGDLLTLDVEAGVLA